MALPAKLKNFILFEDGIGYKSEVPELTLPKVALKTEKYRGGGMLGEVSYVTGVNELDFEWTLGGLPDQTFAQFGSSLHDASQLRYVGAYQDTDGGTTQLEIAVRGRHEEMDFGSRKAGDNTQTKIKTMCTYYRLSIDGSVRLEIDMINNIFIVDGVDRMAEVNAALGG